MKKVTTLLMAITSCLGAATAQHSPSPDVKNLASRAEAIDRGLAGYRITKVDVSGVVPDEGHSQLVTYTDGGKLFKAVNEQKHEDGGMRSESFYYDAAGQFVVALVASHSFGEDGTHFYHDETLYFKNKLLLATSFRDGEFPKGEKFDGKKLRRSLVPSSETDAPKRDSYEYHLNRAQTTARLVKAFSGKRADTRIPAHSILESVSPDGRFLVKWRREGDDRADFDLIDLETGNQVGHVTDGLQPGTSSIRYWARWSDDSKFLTFGMDARWTTMGADLFSVTPDRITRIGNFNQSVGRLAYRHLKKQDHTYAKNTDSVHGFVRVLSVENDGRVHLVLSTQTKSENPQDNFDTEMTVQLDGDRAARANGVRLLKPGEEPNSSAADDAPEPAPAPVPEGRGKEKSQLFVITPDKIGNITRETRFNLKAVRKLFPDHRVTAGRETFEEGEEQPVIHIIADRVAVLTIVPIPNTTEISHVYTTSPRVATQLGFTVGDSFADIFESTPVHANYEGISGEVITQAPGISNVQFHFFPEEGNPDDDGLPDYDKLKRWKLQSIKWSGARG